MTTALTSDLKTWPDGFARLHEAGVRRSRTQTYGSLDVEQFLRDVGLRWVKAQEHGEWVSFRCPFHDDRKPSAAMHKVRTTWRCHACRCGGNAARLLSMLKGISTRQAHHRIMARDYDTEIELAPHYVRKTSRTSSGSQQDIRVQQEHAVELLHKGASYNRAVVALTQIYGISESTAKRRLRAAKVILGTARPGTLTRLGPRARMGLPTVVGRFGEEGLILHLPKRVSPVQPLPSEGSKRIRKSTTGGGSNKTANLTPTVQRTGAPSRPTWPGPRWQRPRVVRAGVYYELADGRVVHETHRPRSEIDWLAVGTLNVKTKPTAMVTVAEESTGAGRPLGRYRPVGRDRHE